MGVATPSLQQQLAQLWRLVIWGALMVLPLWAQTPGDLSVWQNLFDTTNGEAWLHCSGYRDNPCNSSCVTCSDGRITDLWLSNNNLTGTLPDLSGLSSLFVLLLANNSLHGTLPPLPFPSAHVVDLSSNYLSGNLPDLKQLTRVQWLKLADNELSGTIPPLEQCAKLIVLALAGNKLTGTVPPISALTKLVWLRLDSNNLHGHLPNLEAMTALEVFGAANNSLTGTIPPIGSTVSWFDVSSNSLSGTLPSLSNATSLTMLDVGHNRLRGVIPRLSHLTNLATLALNDNFLTGTFPALPASIFTYFPSQLVSKNVVAIHNNFLSCALSSHTEPPLATYTHNNTIILVASGNQFSQEHGKVPAWLSPNERNSRLLFVVFPPLYSLIAGGAVAGAIVLVMVSYVSIRFLVLRHLSLQRHSACHHSSKNDDDMSSTSEQSCPSEQPPQLQLLDNSPELQQRQQSEQHAHQPPQLTTQPQLSRHSQSPRFAPFGLYVDEQASPSRPKRFSRLPPLPQLSPLPQQLGQQRHAPLCRTQSNPPQSPQAAIFCVLRCLICRPLRNEDPVVRLVWLNLKCLMVLFVVGGLGLIPTYLAGGKLFTCGEALFHFSLAYLANAPTSEWVAAVLICVYSAVAMLGVAWVRGRGRAHYFSCGIQLSKPPGDHWRNTYVQPMLACGEECELRRKAHKMAALRSLKIPFTLRGILGVFLWGVTVLLLSVPVMLYELVDSLPEDNTLGFNESGITLIRVLTAPLLAFVSSAVVPVVCDTLVSFGSQVAVSSHTFQRSPEDDYARKKLVVRLILLTRLVLLVIVPVAVVVVVDNGCLQLWKYFWRPCRSNTTSLNVFITGDTDLLLPRVVSTNQICRRVFSHARCPRKVIGMVSSLMLMKMNYQAFLIPLFLLAWHGCVRPWLCFRVPPAWRRGLVNRALGPMSSDNFGLIVITWIEVGIVFGGSAPLVLVSVALALVTNLATYRVLGFVQNGMCCDNCDEGIWRTTQRSLVCPPLAYLALSVCIQCLLVVWVFYETELGGWQVVVVALPLLAGCLVLHLCTRIGGKLVAIFPA